MKSSFCDTSACVEVEVGDEVVVLTDPEGHEVFYTRQEWRAFVLGVKAGEFDVPE